MAAVLYAAYTELAASIRKIGMAIGHNTSKAIMPCRLAVADSAAAGDESKRIAALRHQKAASGRSARIELVARQKISHPAITTVASTYLRETCRFTNLTWAIANPAASVNTTSPISSSNVVK